MQLGQSLTNWTAVLAEIAVEGLSAFQARRSIVVSQRDGRFIIRRSVGKGEAVLAELPLGAVMPRELSESLRNLRIDFEVAPETTVIRRLNVPAKAQEFLPGIVRNQIERLSPWPISQAAYGFAPVSSRNDAQMLDVQVHIIARSTINVICDQLKTIALVPDRFIASHDDTSKAAPIVIWTRPSLEAEDQLKKLPRMIAIGLGATLAISVLLSAWAFYAANAAWQEYDDVALRVSDIEKHDQHANKSAALKSRDPSERAWALKEQTPAAVLMLDALARALPDSAFLSELHFEKATLRIIGLATDPPPLIGALEQSKRFSSVHFFAPTTKESDGGRYRFYIEAHVPDNLVALGD